MSCGHRRCAVVFAALLIAGGRASAQVGSADSDIVAIAIAKSLLLDLRTEASHHAPVRFTTGPSASMAAWVSRVAPLIRRDAPEVTADSGARSASTFYFSDVAISSNAVVVHGSFIGCDLARPGLNYWNLSVAIEIARQGTEWQPARPRTLSIGDGHCSAKPPNTRLLRTGV